MSWFEIYVLMLLPEIKELFRIINGFSIGTLFLAALFWLHVYSEEEDTTIPSLILKWNSVAVVVCLLLSVLIPSHQTLMAMIGGSVITNIEGVNELPANMVDAANHYLTESINDAVKQAAKPE